MNIFVELLHSVYDGKSYPLFLKDRKLKTFFFGVLLASLYYLVVIIAPCAQFQVVTGGIMQVADEYIPDFELSGGRLSLERSFYLEKPGYYIYVDTEDFKIDDDEGR